MTASAHQLMLFQSNKLDKGNYPKATQTLPDPKENMFLLTTDPCRVEHRTFMQGRRGIAYFNNGQAHIKIKRGLPRTKRHTQ